MVEREDRLRLEVADLVGVLVFGLAAFDQVAAFIGLGDDETPVLEHSHHAAHVFLRERVKRVDHASDPCELSLFDLVSGHHDASQFVDDVVALPSGYVYFIVVPDKLSSLVWDRVSSFKLRVLLKLTAASWSVHSVEEVKHFFTGGNTDLVCLGLQSACLGRPVHPHIETEHTYLFLFAFESDFLLELQFTRKDAEVGLVKNGDHVRPRQVLNLVEL